MPHERIRVEHTDEAVGMDEPATTPIRRKPNSSIRRCAELVAAGEAEAMVSAGNTGAAVISARMEIGTLEGVDRPALAAVFPSRSGRTVVLDVGANVDSKPAHLRQFAVMGHFYAREILGTAEPRIGLLSIGEEEGKGTEVTREVASVLRTTGLNFVGNVEGHDVFSGAVDVIVCDGFVGNVVLKSAEALAELIAEMSREELARTWRARLGLALARPAIEALQRRTDYEEMGAVPLLGVRGGCFIAHGRSSARAVASAIRSAAEFSAAELPTKIRDSVAELHRQERRLLGVEPARRRRADRRGPRMSRARIIGTGMAVPEKVLTNADLEKMVDTSDEWIVSRTGIRERRIAAEDEALSDFAIPAVRRALDMAGIAGSEVDLVICATVSPDTPFPATSTQIQAAIGAAGAAAFDVSAACTGFIYGLGIANQFLRAGGARTALVVGGEILTKFTDWTDRNTCVLFGDGAGAVVLRADGDNGRGVLGVKMHSDGSLGDLISRPGGGSRRPPTLRDLEADQSFIKMRGNETFKIAVRSLAEVSDEVLKDAGIAHARSTGSFPIRPTCGSSRRSAGGSRSATGTPTSTSSATATPRRRRCRSRSTS